MRPFVLLVPCLSLLAPAAVAQAVIKPLWHAESNQVGAGFGSAVSSAGDVNGDGFDDVLVGSYQFDGAFRDAGGAAVFHGSSAGPSKLPDWSAEGRQGFANFGETVAGAGDVNGDGFDDVLVGAPQGGSVDLYLGSTTGLGSTPAWSLAPGSYTFGWDVAGAGDVNGDGYDDVAYSHLQYTNGQANEGRAFVHFGAPAGPALVPDWTVEGDQAYSYFASTLASAGDVNGDGYGDLLIGAHAWDNGQRNEGRLFVYLGSATGLGTSAAWTGESDIRDAGLGSRVARGVDVNGDGFDDVLANANNFNDGEGATFAFYGSPSGPAATPSWMVTSGQAVGLAGGLGADDFDGDGFGDVLVGYYNFNNGQPSEGAALVYFGSPRGLTTRAGLLVESNQSASQFGQTVSSAGDVNGDGFADFVVGAYTFDNGQRNEGRAFTYLGFSRRRIP